MRSSANTLDEYFASLPEDRKPAMTALRNSINKNIPYKFIGELMKKMTVKDWIGQYEIILKK